MRQVSAIGTTSSTQLEVTGVIPIRVRLIAKANAKSHRPEELFSERTCPIVGAGKLGELFVKGTKTGLEALEKLIDNGKTDSIVKELSCVESIEAVTPALRRNGVSAEDLLRKSPRGKEGFFARVRLFNLGADRSQAKLVEQFEKICKERKIAISKAGYSEQTYVYGAECRNVADVEAIANLVSVRSISSMPYIRTLRPKMVNAKPLPAALLSRQDVVGDVPVVAVVDTGISKQIPALESWVVGRDSQVAPPYRNTEHGTFVAGLICWGGALNPTLAHLQDTPCALYDLQVIPNNDPSKGDVESIREQELLVALEEALRQHANEYKVWNLSLGTDSVCSLDEFSAFAEELDNLQEQYKVSFVVSAGNYVTPPLLDFPRVGAQLDDGRITTPADSVLAITVGAVSHVDYKQTGSKMHEPTSYSRHGAGPNHVIKPDLVHYGGACSADATHTSGIRSLSGNGTAEDLGTSFATPLVSRTLAQIYHQITPQPSPVLARALLTHHARDPRTSSRVPDTDVDYYGFGLPAPVPYCLECTSYTSTLVFEDTLRPGYFLEWDDFPYPSSLKRGGRYFGEVWMTVAFAPARGARWGSEYCETHIDAHFGVYRPKRDPKTKQLKPTFVGLVPPEHKSPGKLYESYQVANLRKWAPVRTYHGDMGKKGELGDRWRLKLQLLSRHGVDMDEARKAQPFALIVTIADPNKKALVYDEMARTVLNRFQSQNLAVRAASRIRGRAS